TWLLVPVAAPDFPVPDSGGRVRALSSWRGKPVLLYFYASMSQHRPAWRTSSPECLAVSLSDSDGVAGIYDALYRYLFDRHRDLDLPTSFLIDANGDIVKLYRGRIDAEQVEQDVRQIPRTPPDRLAKALPFAGNSTTYEFGRNN